VNTPDSRVTQGPWADVKDPIGSIRGLADYPERSGVDFKIPVTKHTTIFESGPGKSGKNERFKTTSIGNITPDQSLMAMNGPTNRSR
jgi:hypothetical protein